MYMLEATGQLLRIPDGSGFPDTGNAMATGEKYGCAVTGKKDKKLLWVVISKKKTGEGAGFFLQYNMLSGSIFFTDSVLPPGHRNNFW
jgi:hypothetical protein